MAVIARAAMFFVLCSALSAEVMQQKEIDNNQAYVFEMTYEGKKIVFDIPQGSIGSDVTLKVCFDLLSGSISHDDSVIRQSLDALPENLRYFNEYLYELAVFSGAQERKDPFVLPIKLAVYYRDADNDGMVDGSDPVIFEEKLKVFMLNNDNLWVRVGEQSSDIESNVATFYISAPACVALIGQVNYSDNADNVKIYPNPIKLNGSGRFASSSVRFENIPTDSVIKICSLSGEFVVKLAETDTDGIIEWDIRNYSGRSISSGVYLALIKSGGSQKVYKFAVER